MNEEEDFWIYIVKWTNKTEIRPKEQSEKTELLGEFIE